MSFDSSPNCRIMKQKLLVLLAIPLLLVTMFIGKADAEAPVPEPKKDSWTKEEVKDLVDKYADKYGVSRNQMQFVVNCESSYNYKAIGDNGRSFGLSQIFSPSHPEITKEQSFDADFALDFMAKNIANGNGNIWTCNRIYKGI